MLVSTGQQQMHGKASPIRHDFSPQYRYCTTTVGADTITTGVAIIAGAIIGAVASISPQRVLNPVS
jgi:hypothetical protein